MPIFSCNEYKSTFGAAPCQLKDPGEARDFLLRVSESEGYCIADFKFGSVAFPLELMAPLKVLVGQRCGVLKIAGSYRILCLDEPKSVMKVEG